jgi:hypothetical protein
MNERNEKLAQSAERRAAQLRKTWDELNRQSSGGSWIRASRKGEQKRYLLQEAARFELLAMRYRGESLTPEGDGYFDAPVAVIRGRARKRAA